MKREYVYFFNSSKVLEPIVSWRKHSGICGPSIRPTLLVTCVEMISIHIISSKWLDSIGTTIGNLMQLGIHWGISLPCVFFVAHGKQDFCRVPLSLPCVPFLAHGKYALCRVPEIVHTAKILAHGKLRVSGSVCWTLEHRWLKFSPVLEGPWPLLAPPVSAVVYDFSMCTFGS